MADQPTPQPQQQATGLPVVVNAQYIKDLSFENPNAPQVFGMTNMNPNLDVHVDLQTRSGPQDSYEVTIVIKAQAKTDSTTAFVIELAYAGLFTLQGIPPEALQPVLLIEAPRILFPFARNIIADVTRDGGFAPLMLQPIDFAEMYRRHVTSQGKTAEHTTVGNA